MPGRDGIPSVTEILDDVGLGWQGWGGLATERRAFLLARGKAVHTALHRLVQGEPLPTPLHEALAKPVQAYRAWARDVQHRSLGSEIEMVHSTKLYMGHIDRFGYCQGQPTLIDFKITASPDLDAAAYQLAGYYLLLTDAIGQKAHPLKHAVVVALNPDTGDWRQHDLTDVVEARLHIFNAAVVLHHARLERDRGR
jgi:hypothetical protein